MKKKLLTFLLIFLIVFGFNHIYAEEIIYDSYVTDEGITINSYCKNWTGNKLKEIDIELRKNTHGDELKLLSTINLYPNNPSGGKEEGLYHGYYKIISIFGKQKVKMTGENTIDLYNLSNKNNVKEFAKTLSHEYGHHFTLYYLIKYENKTFENWEETLLLKARNLNNHPMVRKDYTNGHKWSFIEICAEDYIQLFGSPTAKNIKYFEDIVERASNNNLNNSVIYNNNLFNISPQENMEIPLALEIQDLREYWELASGFTSNQSKLTKPCLALTEVKRIGNGKKQFKFEWTKSIDENNKEASLYSIIALDYDKDIIIPIKTVNQGNQLSAIVGSIKIKKGNKLFFYTDSFITTPKNIILLALNEDGSIIASDNLYIDFNRPIVEKLNYGYNSNNGNITEDINEIDNEQIHKQNNYLDKFFDFLFYLIDKLI